jgi:hypothetical protein
MKDILASSPLSASPIPMDQRHAKFWRGDLVKHRSRVGYRGRIKYIGGDAACMTHEYATDGTWSAYLRDVVHVEPTTCVEATISGEAKP